MVITFDPGSLNQLFDLPMSTALWRIFFWYFGWLPVAVVMLKGVLDVWLFNRRGNWEHHQKFILLAIDVPRNNQQSLLAVENMFVYFAGAHGTFNLIEKWWEGKVQLGFSFEIVSIGGYIQYLIRTPEPFRYLVESAVYSQYPDAEIYEVEDYTKIAPNAYPDEEYDIWGSEFVQVANEMLPIKTYLEFEHDFGEKETKFRDPLTSLMDLMSSLKKGEQLWYQILVIPTDTSWVKHADHYLDELMQKPHGTSKGNQIVDTLIKWIGDFSESVYQLWGHVEDKHDVSTGLKYMDLTPNIKNKIDAVSRKVAKMGFESTIRFIYFSRKDVMNKAKVVNGFVGYIKQFNSNELNSLKPDTKVTMTSTAYLFADRRLSYKKNSLMLGYKHRSDLIGQMPWILNVEELATLWHFPLDAVTKAPLINRAAGKRIEPPVSLPIDTERSALHNIEPIFDEGFTIEDDDAVVDTQPEHASHSAHKSASDKPGFFDEEEEIENEAADESAAKESPFDRVEEAGDYEPERVNSLETQAYTHAEPEKIAESTPLDPDYAPAGAHSAPYLPSEEGEQNLRTGPTTPRRGEAPPNLPFE